MIMGNDFCDGNFSPLFHKFVEKFNTSFYNAKIFSHNYDDCILDFDGDL